MPLQWCNQIWQSLEEGAGKRCSERGTSCVCSGWLRTVRARGTTRRRRGVRSAGQETSGGVGATAGLRLKCVNTGSSSSNQSSGAV